MPKLFIGFSLKWIIRIVLLLFYSIGIVAHYYGYPALEWLMEEHKYIWTMLTVFSTIMLWPFGGTKTEVILERVKEKAQPQKTARR